MEKQWGKHSNDDDVDNCTNSGMNKIIRSISDFNCICDSFDPFLGFLSSFSLYTNIIITASFHANSEQSRLNWNTLLIN